MASSPGRDPNDNDDGDSVVPDSQPAVSPREHARGYRFDSLGQRIDRSPTTGWLPDRRPDDETDETIPDSQGTVPNSQPGDEPLFSKQDLLDHARQPSSPILGADDSHSLAPAESLTVAVHSGRPLARGSLRVAATPARWSVAILDLPLRGSLRVDVPFPNPRGASDKLQLLSPRLGSLRGAHTPASATPNFQPLLRGSLRDDGMVTLTIVPSSYITFDLRFWTSKGARDASERTIDRTTVEELPDGETANPSRVRLPAGSDLFIKMAASVIKERQVLVEKFHELYMTVTADTTITSGALYALLRRPPVTLPADAISSNAPRWPTPSIRQLCNLNEPESPGFASTLGGDDANEALQQAIQDSLALPIGGFSPTPSDGGSNVGRSEEDADSGSEYEPSPGASSISASPSFIGVRASRLAKSQRNGEPDDNVGKDDDAAELGGLSGIPSGRAAHDKGARANAAPPSSDPDYRISSDDGSRGKKRNDDNGKDATGKTIGERKGRRATRPPAPRASMVKNGKLSDTYTTTVGDDDQIEASGLLGELFPFANETSIDEGESKSKEKRGTTTSLALPKASLATPKSQVVSRSTSGNAALLFAVAGVPTAAHDVARLADLIRSTASKSSLSAAVAAPVQSSELSDESKPAADGGTAKKKGPSKTAVDLSEDEYDGLDDLSQRIVTCEDIETAYNGLPGRESRLWRFFTRFINSGMLNGAGDTFTVASSVCRIQKLIAGGPPVGELKHKDCINGVSAQGLISKNFDELRLKPAQLIGETFKDNTSGAQADNFLQLADASEGAAPRSKETRSDEYNSLWSKLAAVVLARFNVDPLALEKDTDDYRRCQTLLGETLKLGFRIGARAIGVQVPSMLVGNVLLPLNLTLSFVKKKATKPVLYWHPRGGYEAGRKAIRLPSLQDRDDGAASEPPLDARHFYLNGNKDTKIRSARALQSWEEQINKLAEESPWTEVGELRATELRRLHATICAVNACFENAGPRPRGLKELNKRMYLINAELRGRSTIFYVAPSGPASSSTQSEWQLILAATDEAVFTRRSRNEVLGLNVWLSSSLTEDNTTSDISLVVSFVSALLDEATDSATFFSLMSLHGPAPDDTAFTCHSCAGRKAKEDELDDGWTSGDPVLCRLCYDIHILGVPLAVARKSAMTVYDYGNTVPRPFLAFRKKLLREGRHLDLFDHVLGGTKIEADIQDRFTVDDTWKQHGKAPTVTYRCAMIGDSLSTYVKGNSPLISIDAVLSGIKLLVLLDPSTPKRLETVIHNDPLYCNVIPTTWARNAFAIDDAKQNLLVRLICVGLSIVRRRLEDKPLLAAAIDRIFAAAFDTILLLGKIQKAYDYPRWKLLEKRVQISSAETVARLRDLDAALSLFVDVTKVKPTGALWPGTEAWSIKRWPELSRVDSAAIEKRRQPKASSFSWSRHTYSARYRFKLSADDLEAIRAIGRSMEAEGYVVHWTRGPEKDRLPVPCSAAEYKMFADKLPTTEEVQYEFRRRYERYLLDCNANYWDEHLSVVNIGAFLILQIRNGCLDPATGLPVMLWHQGASTYGGLGHIVQGRTMSTGFTKVAPTVENWDERLCNIYLRTWHSRQFVRALQMSNLRANEAELRSVMGWVGDLVEAGALVGGAAGLSTEEGKDLAASCREASEAVDFSRGWKVLLGDLLKAEEGA